MITAGPKRGTAKMAAMLVKFNRQLDIWGDRGKMFQNFAAIAPTSNQRLHPQRFVASATRIALKFMKRYKSC
ncbi:hypothetical protein [Halomicronema sp. CCY15110]|uniref:hypothetical protein n=1 Tax=Halomicronema sp. CCY15110 TaxID=2767773 RepID=UPI00194FA080|nr:hypothetical protein [Halomicronema sp. CCY15110]